MNGMICFWCGEPLGRKHIATDFVGGKTIFFHRGMWKDCKNEFLKWQREEQKQEQARQQRLQQAARSIH